MEKAEKNRGRIAFATLGCKANQYDTEEMRGRLAAAGFAVVPFGQQADVYIVNTCTVTQAADKQGRQLIRRAIRDASGSELPDGAKVIATGCYAQIKPDELGRMTPDVDLIAGNPEKKEIVGLVESLLAGAEEARENGPRLRVSDVFAEKKLESAGIEAFEGRTRPFIKVQDGCNKRCAFCVIPFARGSSRSEAAESVARQARDLAANGYREITLTGIYIGAWGRDLPERSSLAELLRKVAEVEGIERIRVSSIDPREFRPELIEAIGESEKICRHFHISMQSGDDRILQAMRRGYDTNFYRELVESIVHRFPETSIGTDIIVGFPGETEEEFENTRRFAESLPLAYMHVFPYSDRPETAASSMGDKLDPKEIKRRVGAMYELRQQKISNFIEKNLGRAAEILVEARRAEDSGRLTGLTRNNLRVDFDGDDGLMGRLTTVIPERPLHDRAVGRMAESARVSCE